MADRSGDGQCRHVWRSKLEPGPGAPTHGGVAVASSKPDYVDLDAWSPKEKREVKVTTETVTEIIRDGQAFVQRTVTTATCRPVSPRGIVREAGGAVPAEASSAKAARRDDHAEAQGKITPTEHAKLKV